MTTGFDEVRRLAEAGRLAESLSLMHRLAEQDRDPDALITLADFYWRGGPVEQNPKKARDMFRLAAEAGHPHGRMFHTNLLANGVFGERNWREARERLVGEASLSPDRNRAVRLLDAMDLDDEGDPQGLPEGDRMSSDLDVRLFRALLTPDECAHLLATAEPRYMRSTIHDSRGRETPHPLRSSDGAPIHWLIEDPAIQALNRRLATATGTEYRQGEPLLVLRYAPGQEYRRHFDALPGLDNQRVVTALVYLNGGYEGGETAFPKLGLAVKGRPGDVLTFRNTAADGSADPLSEHAGLPVTSGVKYLASRWIRGQSHMPV
ncbi:2OG-Fe(II) oxygenase [Brevundimonas sp. VNH65]|uniref:2OG-Fe(II) oxygenase n=1 Tax=Brevundimonas sp. VNH65 TaxID=3400917 RepID=UPI003C0378F5